MYNHIIIICHDILHHNALCTLDPVLFTSACLQFPLYSMGGETCRSSSLGPALLGWVPHARRGVVPPQITRQSWHDNTELCTTHAHQLGQFKPGRYICASLPRPITFPFFYPTFFPPVTRVIVTTCCDCGHVSLLQPQNCSFPLKGLTPKNRSVLHTGVSEWGGHIFTAEMEN